MMLVFEHVSDAFIVCINNHQPEKNRRLLKSPDECDYETTQRKVFLNPVVPLLSIVYRLFTEPASAPNVKTKTESKICKFIIIIIP